MTAIEVLTELDKRGVVLRVVHNPPPPLPTINKKHTTPTPRAGGGPA
jgi:hypothetical protein